MATERASVARVSEISARSPDSFEDAVKVGVQRATQTLRNVTHVWVKELEAYVEDGQIATFQVNLEVTFDLEDR